MKNFTQGLIFGTIVGGLVALLNTPRSGEVNRRRLQSYIQTNTDSVNELAESLKIYKALFLVYQAKAC